MNSTPDNHRDLTGFIAALTYIQQRMERDIMLESTIEMAGGEFNK